MRVGDFRGVLAQGDYERVAAVVSDGDLAAGESERNVSKALADALIAATKDGHVVIPPASPAAAEKGSPEFKKNENVRKAAAVAAPAKAARLKAAGAPAVAPALELEAPAGPVE